MAGKTGEISALLNLIEDPDEAVYQTVSSRKVEEGSEILSAHEEMSELEDDVVPIHNPHMLTPTTLIVCISV